MAEIQNPYMAGAYGVGAVTGFVNSIVASNALRRQGRYQAKMLELNKRLAEYQAGDALRRGERTAEDYEKKLSALMGSQRVATAAQNVQLGEGSAAEIQADTAAQGADDVVTIRANAWREAWGYRAQAQEYTRQGDLAVTAANNAANQTVLGGLTTAADGLLKSGWVASGGNGNLDRRVRRPGIGGGWNLTDKPLSYSDAMSEGRL